MANTGVLPFVRGVDFAHNDFSVSQILFLIQFLRYLLLFYFDINSIPT